jgi:NAD(P)-dependent dehydrogenase (short-subunit alcohol dehydrogenase family)
VTTGRFEGQGALVTGGGRGIGKAVALRLASEGAIVALCGRDRAPVEAVAAMIEQSGGVALARALSIDDETAIEAFVQETTDHFGRLDVLVNNAALTAMSNIGYESVLEMSTAEWQRVVNINLSGAFFMSRAAGKVMRSARRGAIVNVSSVHAHVPNALTPHYDATKSAIESLTRNLALLLGRFGVRVNAIAPGPIDVTGGELPEGYTAEARDSQRRATGLGRFGRPEEMAAAIAFLASDEASYITGTTLVADGGFLLRHPGMTDGGER